MAMNFTSAKDAPGASIRRPPDFRTCTMPLITRRSSTRGLPRVSLGRSGPSRVECVSRSPTGGLDESRLFWLMEDQFFIFAGKRIFRSGP